MASALDLRQFRARPSAAGGSWHQADAHAKAPPDAPSPRKCHCGDIDRDSSRSSVDGKQSPAFQTDSQRNVASQFPRLRSMVDGVVGREGWGAFALVD